MCHDASFLLRLDAGDRQLRIRLPVTALPTVLLASLEFNDLDLRAAALFRHLRRHARTLDQRCAYRHRLTICYQQNVGKLDLLACFGSQLFHLDRVAFGNLILFATRFDYCVHLPVSVDCRAYPAL